MVNVYSVPLEVFISEGVHVVFVTGQGGVGFHSAGPALSAAQGGYFLVIPTPHPSRAQPYSFPGRGPVCHNQTLTGIRLRSRWGGSPGGARGREGQRLCPALVYWAGERARGPQFSGPWRPHNEL